MMILLGRIGPVFGQHFQIMMIPVRGDCGAAAGLSRTSGHDDDSFVATIHAGVLNPAHSSGCSFHAPVVSLAIS